MLSPFTAHFPARYAVLRSIPGIALATFVGVFCTAAFAVETPLTLMQAQQLAVERSRQLAAKDHATMASREMAIAAGQLPDPVLKMGVDNLPIEGADRFNVTRDFMTQRRIGVMQDLTRADKRRLRAERFEREADKSVAEKTAATAAIQRETALAWVDRYYAEAMAAVITEQASQAKLEIQAAEGAYRAGRGSQADIFNARSALVAFDDRASEIQRRIRNAKAMLARWVGDAAESSLAGKPSIETVALDAATLETQLNHHPTLAVLAAQEEIAATEAKLAQANKKADWSVELAYQQRGPAYSNMISVGVSIPLQWDQKNRQDREVSAKLANLEQARAEREDTLRAHVAEVRSILNEWENNRERHARYDREFIPLANASTGATIAAYRGGKATLADVLAARRNEIDVRLKALTLETDTARLWAQLNFLFPQDGTSAHSTMRMNKESK
jgi:outer membrane protein TolC